MQRNPGPKADLVAQQKPCDGGLPQLICILMQLLHAIKSLRADNQGILGDNVKQNPPVVEKIRFWPKKPPAAIGQEQTGLDPACEVQTSGIGTLITLGNARWN